MKTNYPTTQMYLIEGSIRKHAYHLGFYVNHNNCWICNSHKTKDGQYARFRRNGKEFRIHRFMYEITYGKIPAGMIVRHKCDEPLCINPDHLELGTHADNARDKVSRNRQPKGTQIKSAKLNEEAVYYIKFISTENDKELARRYKVNISTIRSIKKGITWKHVVQKDVNRNAA
jgi:hypothetical protein